MAEPLAVIDDGGVAVVAHVLLQHLSVVSGALALLGEGRARSSEDRTHLLEQASAANDRAVVMLHELLRGRFPDLRLP